MLKTRLILTGSCALAIFLLFQLPKSVVENENVLGEEAADTISSHIQNYAQTPDAVRKRIQQFRMQMTAGAGNEKNAIFADSLANLYRIASQFDSAAWFAEEASEFFNNIESWLKAGDNYYQAYTLAVDPGKQVLFAEKAQRFYNKVLASSPGNLDVKTKLAMTYLTSANPMQGITMLREVLTVDPKHELALFNMGVLSIQSGQHGLAIERLRELVKVNPGHLQGQLLLGLALMKNGDRASAKEQFEKVKQMDQDPAVQATVDSYLEDLK